MERKIVIEGKPGLGSFDVSYYSDTHDVPALWIGHQIVALGNGLRSWPLGKDEDHLAWRLDFAKTYRVTIEEIEDE